MAYQALYRKYRPSTFNDFIDQDSVKKILINSIKNNKISHAYLFSGPRGIGKTSMAKIFAKAINCTNFLENDDVCNKCSNCLEADNDSVDIIEIDAASNNGVDQIRELKNKISIVPSSLKYKVYIIDEVHMLTNSAFNALLKTLEEPPSYVVFILATTEFYEVPETIVSRCQCYSFGRISLKSMKERLKFIAKEEKIKIDDDAIEEIALYANGGLRDAISMLDKIRSFTDDKITVDIFKNINGMVSQSEINTFYESVLNKDIKKILEIIDQINETGYDFKNFIERVMLCTRDNIVDYYVNKKNIFGSVDENVELVSVLNDILNRLKEAVNPMVVVQVLLLKFMETNVKNISQEINLGEKSVNKNIAREIISDNKTEEDNNKNIAREIKISEKTVENVQNEVKKTTKPRKIKENDEKTTQISINEDIKNIRINNTLATANKNYKTELLGIWDKLSDYFMDDKYGKVAQLLSDTSPMVVGTENVILAASSDGIITNVYANLSQIEDFLQNIYHLLKVVIIPQKDFDVIKDKYVNDLKNNIVYEVKEEYDKLVNESNSLISKALDIFGSDMVDIE